VSKRVIYTSAVSRHMPWWGRWVKKRFERYATRVGATLVNLPSCRHRGRLGKYWVKFDAFKRSLVVAEQYPDAQFLWLDADVILRPMKVPNLFELGEGLWSCVSDNGMSYRPRSYRQNHYMFGVPLMAPHPTNAIILWGKKEARAILREYANIPSVLRIEQRLTDEGGLCVLAYKAEIPIQWVPAGWHRMTSKFHRSTQFFHAAGGGKMKKCRRALRIIRRVRQNERRRAKIRGKR